MLYCSVAEQSLLRGDFMPKSGKFPQTIPLLNCHRNYKDDTGLTFQIPSTKLLGPYFQKILCNVKNSTSTSSY